MQIVYEKIALAAIEPGTSLDKEYCPMLISGPLTKTYVEHGFQQVGTAVVTVTYFSPEAIQRDQLGLLNEQLQATRAENQKRENAILDRISKLQALSFVEAA